MHLEEVPYVLNEDYVTYMENYLNRIIDPSISSTDFPIDIVVEDLDYYEEVRDFIFE